MILSLYSIGENLRTLFLTIHNTWIQAIIIGFIGGIEVLIGKRIKRISKDKTINR
jgi:hypothetical protein